MTTATSSRDKSQGTIVKRVSKKGHDDGHGGAWKVAFADFMLALMCLFLVLWVLAARDSEQATEEVRRAAGGKLFDDGGSMIERATDRTRGSLIPREPVLAQSSTVQPTKQYNGHESDSSAQKAIQAPAQAQTPTQAPRRFETVADLRELSMIITHLAEDAGLRSNLQTIITPYGLRVMLHDTERVGMFERGNAFPSDRFRRLLRSLGPVFAQAENQLLVIGHTDSIPFANADASPVGQSNWSLSSHRATAARFHMMAGGLPGSHVLQVVGMADRAPVDASKPAAGVNRRIELLVLTPEHAQAIAAMFGPPAASAPLAPGVDASLPETSALQALRERLRAR